MKNPLFLLFLLFSVSCGSKKTAKKTQPQRGLPQQLDQTAHEYNLPVRLLKAVAFLESRVQPTSHSMVYDNTALSLNRTQTALGLSRSTLNLHEQENADDLIIQFKAYASFMRQRLQNQNLQFSNNPKQPDEWFHWMWEMAQVHRQGSRTRRNTHVIFVRELIKILNKGFIKTLPSGEALTLEPQSPPLHEKNFSSELQKYLKLSSTRSPIDGVLHLNLVADNSSNTPLLAQSIEVVHCPFSLSACLDLQSPTQDESVKLRAHYIIPQDDSLTGLPLEVSRHDYAVELTSEDGLNTMSDKVVIMLTGHSGQVSQSVRVTAHPTWITPWQLQSMAQVVHAVCQRMAWDQNTSADSCLQQTSFRHDQKSLRWGDIMDYDPLIFNAYLNDPVGLPGEVAIDIQNKAKRLKAGQAIRLQLKFQPQAQQVVLEELTRCEKGEMVWSLFYKAQVRSQTHIETQPSLWDSGPNKDGTHYFRMKAYNKEGTLLGWDVTSLLLKDYEDDSLSAAPESCWLKASVGTD
ncbi:MAG: hypothetical protein AB8C84_08980 [Oligoflexales bacterium]